METKYVWKELSEEGLLKEPKPFNPYSTERLNEFYRPCRTRDAAIQRLKDVETAVEMDELNWYDRPQSLVLVEVFET